MDTNIEAPNDTLNTAVGAMPLLLRAKCVVVGDSGVGKSAIAQSFHSDGTHFPKAYTMVSRTRSRRGCRLQGSCMHRDTGQ